MIKIVKCIKAVPVTMADRAALESERDQHEQTIGHLNVRWTAVAAAMSACTKVALKRRADAGNQARSVEDRLVKEFGAAEARRIVEAIKAGEPGEVVIDEARTRKAAAKKAEPAPSVENPALPPPPIVAEVEHDAPLTAPPEKSRAAAAAEAFKAAAPAKKPRAKKGGTK